MFRLYSTFNLSANVRKYLEFRKKQVELKDLMERKMKHLKNAKTQPIIVKPSECLQMESVSSIRRRDQVGVEIKRILLQALFDKNSKLPKSSPLVKANPVWELTKVF